jgi:hypothetical protein
VTATLAQIIIIVISPAAFALQILVVMVYLVEMDSIAMWHFAIALQILVVMVYLVKMDSIAMRCVIVCQI